MNFHSLANLFPLLPENELNNLAEDIKANGLVNPIWLYRGEIIDGRNRFLACEKVGIEPIFKEYEGTESELLPFVLSLNLSRRHLNESQRAAVADKIANMTHGGNRKSVQSANLPLDNTPSISVAPVTVSQAAELLNVSERTVKSFREAKEKCAPEIVKAIVDGDITIHAALKEQKIEQRKEKIQAQRIAIENDVIEKPNGLFDVLVVDPPWAYGREYDPETSRVANPYPEMAQSELLNIEIPAKKDAVLFLWTTHQFIFDAKELMDKWGFVYKATMVWDKEKIGMGAWLRMQCEFCLVGIKGKPFWENTEHRDIIREARREHSRKPETFYSVVEKITAGRKVDYFSREMREGWEAFGNDTKKF
jgi:N6-adenosine-specific RNA methylase IME4